jgi:hypothetical protein
MSTHANPAKAERAAGTGMSLGVLGYGKDEKFSHESAKAVVFMSRGWVMKEGTSIFNPVYRIGQWTGNEHLYWVDDRTCGIKNDNGILLLPPVVMSGHDIDTGWIWSKKISPLLKENTEHFYKTILYQAGFVESLNGEPVVSQIAEKTFNFLTGIYLGGHGFKNVIPQRNVCILMLPEGVLLSNNFKPWSDFQDIAITGPGLYETGGGWWGGGLGVKGALEGAAFASIMNFLTTRTHIETFVRMIFEDAELNLYISHSTPEDLDIKFSFLRGILANPTKHEATKEIREFGFCTKCGAPKLQGGAYCGKCGNAF